MTRKKKIVQIGLLIVGFILIFATYFVIPKLNKKDLLVEDKFESENIETESLEVQKNLFENVEYKGIYNVENNFTLTAEKAQISEKDSDVVYMENMKAKIYMNDGRIIVVRSDKGKYNKLTNDCFFEKNVKATDSKTIILSENLDLLATKDFASVYNNVSLKNDNGSLKADIIDYNFKTKFYKVSMFSDERVKIKLINWNEQY